MLETIKGTRDILPDEIGHWQRVEAAARELFARHGFREIRTPIFEATELFARGIGEATDIVAKEMYTFADRKGRSLTLRPEGTAPVVRAYIQHGLGRGAGVERLYYIGPMFRYERPQKGRMRQFSQIGAEAFGSDHPAVDAEVLELVLSLLETLGIAPVELALNSVGCETCRPGYREALRRFLLPLRDVLCDDCRRRLETNPMRCFDCKVPADIERMKSAPSIQEHLCADCREHFSRVRGYLDGLGRRYVVDPRLVRGLDYYRRTAFEVTRAGLGAQNALLGGGRYDGLVKDLGGPSVPGFGFAVGEDRLVLSLPAEAAGDRRGPEIFVAVLGEASTTRALALARRLRGAGHGVLLDPPSDRSLKALMRRADDLAARFVLILGQDEMERGGVTLKRMRDGHQETLSEDALAGRLAELERG